MSEIKQIAALTLVAGGDWKEHPEAPGYFFSPEGHAARVTLRRGAYKISFLKGCSAGIGYRAISYPLGGGRYGRIYIHRAVCELFNGPQPGPRMCVRHLDCDMHNNRASNLAWGTAQDNADDGKRAGKTCKGEANGMARLTRKDVEEMRLRRIEKGLTFKQLAADFGVSTMTAYRAVTEQSWK